MMPDGQRSKFTELAASFTPPILIVSTQVGRGAYVLGEAIAQQLSSLSQVYHRPVEDLVSQAIFNEDVKRYRFISTYVPWLLYLIYKVPIFYYRKYLREKLFGRADLHKLRDAIETLKVRTVLCVSHRPAFWVSALKRRDRRDLAIWGVGVEFGKNLGWRYQFWDHIDGLLSPVSRQATGVNLPTNVRFIEVELPVRAGFQELAANPGDPDAVLLLCGAWGQGPLSKIAQLLVNTIPSVTIHALCGENVELYDAILRRFGNHPRVHFYRTIPTLHPLLRVCASVVTKPGLGTLLEAHAAGRKIFLLKGMPVAEDNNARYALQQMGAQWFTIKGFSRWHTLQVIRFKAHTAGA
jgi:UDP-N-acetylglucosamine:LPS N-acetylglucosamine transferase